MERKVLPKVRAIFTKLLAHFCISFFSPFTTELTLHHSGYTISSGTGWDICTSVFSTDMTAYLPGNTSTWVDDDGDTVTSVDWDATSSSEIFESGTLYWDPIEVHWRASDLPKIRADYASALVTRLSIDVTPTATPSTLSTIRASPSATAHIVGATAAINGDAPSSSSSLGGGAKAGIALGSIFGVAAVAMGALFLYRRSRRQREENKAVSQPLTASVEAPELVGYHNPGRAT